MPYRQAPAFIAPLRAAQRTPGGFAGTIAIMAVTRSATRSTSTAAAATAGNVADATDTEKAKAPATAKKRKAATSSAQTAQKKPRTAQKTAKAATSTNAGSSAVAASSTTAVPTPIPNPEGEELVPAVLTFSFEEAKSHLISVDPRFEEVFRRVKCRPFEHLERVDPFRCANEIFAQFGLFCY